MVSVSHEQHCRCHCINNQDLGQINMVVERQHQEIKDGGRKRNTH